MAEDHPSRQVATASSFTGGAILGALSISFLADRLGRKMTVFAGSVISILGSALQGGAVNVARMIAGRLIGGCSVGLLSRLLLGMGVQAFGQLSGINVM
jgi:MFS family permease